MVYRLPRENPSSLAHWSERTVYLAIPLALIGILVTRSGQVDPLAGLAVIAFAVLLGLFALVLAGVAAIVIWRTGQTGLGAILRAMLALILLLAMPAYLTMQALRLPRLNDISTDIEDAPAFSTSPQALAAREGATPAMLDPRRRAAQLRAYPQVQTISLELDAEDAFRLAKETAQALKWRIIEEVPPGIQRGRAAASRSANNAAANARDGRIEAVAETRVLRFRDDVTIRIRPGENETRIDIRSASRIGRHDFGANAARIRTFIEAMTNARD